MTDGNRLHTRFCPTGLASMAGFRESTLPLTEEDAVACQMAMLTSQFARMPRRKACRQTAFSMQGSNGAVGEILSSR